MKEAQPIGKAWALAIVLLAAPFPGWALTWEDQVSTPPEAPIDAAGIPTPPPRPQPIPLPDETRPRILTDEPYTDGYVPPTAVPVPSPYAMPAEVPEYEFELIVRYGDLEGGAQTFTADHNALVTLTVDSDVVETVWVEGYNVGVAVQPGQPAMLKFRAERPGRFAIWYGSAKHEIAVLEIGPPAPTTPGPLPWSFQ